MVVVTVVQPLLEYLEVVVAARFRKLREADL